MEVLGDSNNTSGKSMPLQEQHPVMHHYHNHAVTPNIRRYPAAVPSLDPTQIQMYPAPPQMYTAQNAPCYACLTVPVAGMQNRYSRYIQIMSGKRYMKLKEHMCSSEWKSKFFVEITYKIYVRIILPGAMLNTYTAWRSYKRYGSTPRAVDTVLRAVVLTAPAVGHHPRHHRPRRGSVAPALITITSRRPSPIT